MLLQFLSLAMAGATVLSIAAVAPFFTVMSDPSAVDRNEWLRWLILRLGNPDRSHLLIVLGSLFVALTVAANALNLFGTYLTNRVALGIGISLQSELFDRYLRRPYIFHTSANSAHLFNSVVYEGARFGSGILQNTFVFGTGAITALLIVTSIVLVNPIMAAATAAILMLAYGWIYWSTHGRMHSAGQQQADLGSRQAQIVTEAFGAIKEVTVSQTQSHFRSRFEVLSKAFSRCTARIQLLTQAPRNVIECVAAGGIVVALLLMSGDRDGVGPLVGQLSFFGLAAYRLLPAIQYAYAAVVRIKVDCAALEPIVSDVATAPVSIAQTATAGAWFDKPKKCIALEKVRFRYPGARFDVVRDLSIRIPARSITGLIGPNGCGKTTVADLVAGLLEPDAGRILIDDVALDGGNRAAWQSTLAYVPQNTFLLDASIAENIAIGIPRHLIDRQKLIRAAELAQLHAWVSGLANGYDEQIGERGIRVSGGQRQRISIARGLYRDISVLILDEATNALDVATAQELIATLKSLRAQCTILVITHQRSTLQHCDHIVELTRNSLREIDTLDLSEI